MTFSVKKEKCFIPDIGKNLTAPEAEKLKVLIKLPTALEKEDLIHTDIEFVEGKKKRTLVHTRQETRTILENHVTKIENLEIDDNGKIRKIEDGKALAEVRGSAGINKLIDMICAEIVRPDLTEEQEANL